MSCFVLHARTSYGFITTWRWVNYDRIYIILLFTPRFEQIHWRGFHLVLPIKLLLKLFHLLTLTHASIFSIKTRPFSTIYHLFLPTKRCCALSLLSQVSYTNYPCFILIFVLLYVWGSARCAVGGCSLQETCSEVLDQSLDWSLSKTANSSGVGTNIECGVRFRWHDSGDMPKSSCSGDLLIT